MTRRINRDGELRREEIVLLDHDRGPGPRALGAGRFRTDHASETRHFCRFTAWIRHREMNTQFDDGVDVERVSGAKQHARV